MNQYWVKGKYISRRHSQNMGNSDESHGVIELFGKSYWAYDANDALAAAQIDINGGKWIGEPVVSETSEEMRMRAIGAPELPLDFGSL